MKISIIIPIYNSERTLNKLINSIVNQTYTDYEIILVDDGSKDNSFKLMKELANKNKKIKIFTKINEGPGLTRKYGYEQAQGELLFFIDSDDFLYDNDVLDKIVKLYEENKFEILFFDIIKLVGGEKQRTNAFRNKQLKTGEYNVDELTNYGRSIVAKNFCKRKNEKRVFL